MSGLLIKCQKYEEGCENFSVLLRKSELYSSNTAEGSFSQSIDRTVGTEGMAEEILKFYKNELRLNFTVSS